MLVGQRHSPEGWQPRWPREALSCLPKASRELLTFNVAGTRLPVRSSVGELVGGEEMTMVRPSLILATLLALPLTLSGAALARVTPHATSTLVAGIDVDVTTIVARLCGFKGLIEPPFVTRPRSGLTCQRGADTRPQRRALGATRGLASA